MKKFLSMFFMLSVLPTIGLAVSNELTPYEVTDKHNTNIARINEAEISEPGKKSLHKDYTNTYNNLKGGAVINNEYKSISTIEDCEALVNWKGGTLVTAFAKNIHSQIRGIQEQEVKGCCNLGNNCRYKTVDDSLGFTAKGDPTVTCRATANDERCLLTQKLVNLGLPTKDGYDEKYYYSCNQPELVFSDGFISINRKNTHKICGAITALSSSTAGFIDRRIQLTLEDFDDNCELKDDNIKKLAEGDYGSETEKETLIQEILIRR